MRRLPLVLLLLALPSAWLSPCPAQAQEAPGQTVYVNRRQFYIPFQTVPGENRLKQVQLYVSVDQGKTWHPDAIAAPDQKQFRFLSQADGAYWFAVQTLDQEGRYFPPTLERVQPSLHVVVDTQLPSVTVRALPSRGGEVGVSWDVRDENFDPASPDAVRVEFRPVGSLNWYPVPRRPLGNEMYWNPETNAPLEVRVRARDRAGNTSEASTRVNPLGQSNHPGGGAGESNPGEPPWQAGDAPPYPERRLLNSKRISLNYQITDKGKSGVSSIELWYTQDGRSWNKYPLPKSSDDNIEQGPLVFDVNAEGVYGFTMLAKSGVGLGDRPPQVGDRPQLWIEVDLTKPVVQLQQVLVGQGSDKGKLIITWTARDKNLARFPIAISYTKQAGGPWTPITTEKMGNTGRYVWSMPEDVPYQFLVKVEAVDLAGNVGEAITPGMVKVDLSQPKVKILNVESAGN
jgi:hypothetical protein